MEASLKIVAGELSGARRVESPNFNQRPCAADSDAPADISLLVLHNISLPAGEFGTPHIENLFTNCLDCSLDDSFESLQGLEVSAHCLIRRDGELIQFVNFDQRAWHAGVSEYEGRSACNDFSIGVELEGCDDLPFTEQQYVVLKALSQAILDAYPAISLDRIVGHSDVAPGRKTDPGPAFDWVKYRAMLAQ